MPEALDSLHDALINSLSMMKDDDLVLFNIGNSSSVLQCDMQKNISQWDDVDNSNKLDAVDKILVTDENGEKIEISPDEFKDAQMKGKTLAGV